MWQYICLMCPGECLFAFLELYGDDPMNVQEHAEHPVPNNGTGFSHYFIALSQWVSYLTEKYTRPAFPNYDIVFNIDFGRHV
jgi:hypothetical protein